MTTPVQEQSNKLFNMMWDNWENGFKKVYDAQQELGKASLDALKKQQEILTSMSANTAKTEEEMKKSLEEIINSVKENMKYVGNEEAASMFEGWNSKMTEILNRMQQLSFIPSKQTISMFEQSQDKMYEVAEKSLAEQTKMQQETREMMENFMNQVKESQSEVIKNLDEQSKQAFDKFQTK